MRRKLEHVKDGSWILWSESIKVSVFFRSLSDSQVSVFSILIDETCVFDCVCRLPCVFYVWTSSPVDMFVCVCFTVRPEFLTAKPDLSARPPHPPSHPPTQTKTWKPASSWCCVHWSLHFHSKHETKNTTDEGVRHLLDFLWSACSTHFKSHNLEVSLRSCVSVLTSQTAPKQNGLHKHNQMTQRFTRLSESS